MLAYPFVVLNLFNDGVEDIFAEMKIRFQECDEFLTVMRIDPCAILYTQKTNVAHLEAKKFPSPFSPLRYVKHDQSISMVPFPRLFARKFDLLTAEFKHMFASRC